VRPGGLGIHLRARHRPVAIAYFHDFIDFVVSCNIAFSDVLQVDALLLVLPDGQVVFYWVQQVLHSLVINLDHGHLDFEFNGLVRSLDAVKHIAHHPRHDAL